MMQTQPRSQQQKPSSADTMFSQMSNQERTQYQPQIQTSQAPTYGSQPPSSLVDLDSLFSGQQSPSPGAAQMQQSQEQNLMGSQKQHEDLLLQAQQAQKALAAQQQAFQQQHAAAMRQLEMQQKQLQMAQLASSQQQQQQPQQQQQFQQQPQVDMKQVVNAIEKLLSERVETQLGKVQSLLSDLTMRVISSETKLETITRKLEESGNTNRDVVTRISEISRKQDTLHQQLTELRQTARSPAPSSTAPAPAPSQRSLPDLSQPPPASSMPSFMPPEVTYNPVQTTAPPQSVLPPQYSQAPPPAYVQDQVYQPASNMPSYASYQPQQQQYPPAPPPQQQQSYRSQPQPAVPRQAVQFDDALISDACAMGYPRHKVIETLNKLYGMGKPCNDMNILLDCLEGRRV